MSEQKCIVLNWNVRGLNNRARRQVVKDMANDNACTIAELQETKLAVVNSVDVTEFLGARFSNQFAYLPANNTRGGVLLAVDEDYYTITQSVCHQHSITVHLSSKQCVSDWWITVVYGPQGEQEKVEFLAEVRSIRTTVGDKWLLLGDFNLILHATDKSDEILNRRLMAEFRNTVNFLQMKELSLRGRRFTWSNDTTQTHIDRVFCSVIWDLMLPTASLQALSSATSDHSPLLITGGFTGV